MAAENKTTLTVVVSGAPQSVTVNGHQKVAELMRKALHAAGIQDSDLSGWSLRFAGGGEAIPPEARIAEEGISAGATLFLDRDAGGGGQVAVPPADEPVSPVLVDPAVSAAKFERALADWEANRSVYSERGWILLSREGLRVDVAFTVRLPIGSFQDLVAVPLAVRFGFENYDLWPPSVALIDPIDRRWLQIPRLAALDFGSQDDAGIPSNLFVGGHPATGHVFFCVPGVREYHTHPEHTGDDWLLHRGEGLGTLGQLCDLLWRLAVRPVTGLNIIAQRLAVGQLNSVNQGIELRQENIDQLAAEAQAQMSQVFGQVPGELQAQLPAEIQAQLQGVIDQPPPR